MSLRVIEFRSLGVSLRFIFLLLTSYFPLPTSLNAYSLFSGDGLGELIEQEDAVSRGMGYIKIFDVPKALEFSISPYFEFVESKDESNRTYHNLFNISSVNFALPFPKRYFLRLALGKILDMDFDIKSKAQTIGDFQYTRYVRGKGGLKQGTIGIGRRFGDLMLEPGASVYFGEFCEQWEDSINGNSILDTLRADFFGVAPICILSYTKKGLSMSFSYFHKINLDYFKLATIFEGNFIYNLGNLSLGAGFRNYDNAKRNSLGVEYRKKRIVLKAGLAKNLWDYGGVEEWVISSGIGFNLKARSRIDFSIEYGDRKNDVLKEKVLRFYITIRGREMM